MQSATKPFGILKLTKVEKAPERKLTFREMCYYAFPHPHLDKDTLLWRMKNWPRMANQLWRLGVMIRAGKLTDYPFMYGKLWLTHMHGSGQEQFLGLVSLRAFTNVGRDDIIDEMDEATDDASIKTYNFHGIGTGVTGAVAGDTDIETELTTEYNPNSTRATGTQSQPTSDVYQTVATNTLDSGTPAVTEQGVLTSATVGAGTLLDRHTFTAKNLDGTAGDGLQSTYQLTIASGG